MTAVYGGIKDSLDQNAADILAERTVNRKNELETMFYNEWSDFSVFSAEIQDIYSEYRQSFGEKPFTRGQESQVEFLGDSADILIRMLRKNGVNGVFLILNDRETDVRPETGTTEQKIGLCIRDMDQSNVYLNREDLLLERAPAALAEKTGCMLDSWWEARYTFEVGSAENDGSFFYEPLFAAYENPKAEGGLLAYFSEAHAISGVDQKVVSYSIPLTDESGYPYAVLGIELTVKYLSSLLPSKELAGTGKGCYLLAFYDEKEKIYTPIASNGVLYNRCFESESVISPGEEAKTGGFYVTGRSDTKLYADTSDLRIYDNNNPFENQKLVLVAMTEIETLFAYSRKIQILLLWLSLFSLAVGVGGIFIVSRSFAAPITALARRAEEMKPGDNGSLGHLGITEIDQLVNAIELLGQNVNKEIARTEFFSRMSHDMRTPMNAIISFSSPVLLEGADEKTREDYLSKIHSSGEYLLGLINEVLDMTKIESDKVDLHYEPVLNSALWDTVLPIAEKLAEKKHISFLCEFPQCKDQSLLVDTQHLNQIVLNLLSNAVKFTPEFGKVFFYAALENLSETKMRCTIRVRDTGIGMSEKYLKKLYTPFEQENNNMEGTGLGLAITKKLVDLMGGSIACKSSRGNGTEFSVELVMERPGLPTAQNSVSDHTADLSVLKGKRVLLCEDHPINIQITRKLLERREVSVDCAENGKEGVERFENSPEGYYDAILMDIRMPVMDGLEACVLIRKSDRGDAATVPIIAMTANAFTEDIEKSRIAGMNEHLSKPIEPEKFFETLAQVLRK